MKNIGESEYNTRDILFFIRTRKLFISVCAVLVGLTVAVAIIFNVVYGNLMEDYKSVYAEYSEKSDILHKQNLKHLSGILNGEFTKDQLTNISKGFCKYSLSVNNQPVSKLDFFYSADSTVTVTVNHTIDSKLAYYLPDDVVKLALTDDVSKYFKFVTVNDSKPTISTSATADGYRTDIVFKELKVGESITILANHEIATKLNMNQGTLEIVYNKEAK
ncbi:MAG: hypothetical protein IJF54_07130 [Clostridia bacterium]|nr:hypothetical protein [Clostridia bacterium]